MKNSDIDNFKNLWKICVTDTHSNSELILTELAHIFFLTILHSLFSTAVPNRIFLYPNRLCTA